MIVVEVYQRAPSEVCYLIYTAMNKWPPASVAKYVREDLGQDYIVDTTEVFLAVPNRGSNICTLENGHFAQENGKHYSCDLSYSAEICKINVNNEYTHIVDLIFTKLEFEIFGSPEKAIKDQFTTSETTC